MIISKISAPDKQVMFAYAAKSYTKYNPRNSDYVEVNIPEYLPAIPKDDEVEQYGLSNNTFLNSNFPRASGTFELKHCITLPLLSGTSCPTQFSKGTKFILFIPTGTISDGYLIYA